jgi:hypothetical protein
VDRQLADREADRQAADPSFVQQRSALSRLEGETVNKTVRGFNVVLWQARDQGYALVSDLDLRELLELRAAIGPP